MNPIRNLSTGFSSALKLASEDKIINKSELDNLKKEVKTNDDKAVIELLSKDSKQVSFNILEGTAQKEYNLFVDVDKEVDINKSKFEKTDFTYSTLGEGNKGVTGVTGQSEVSKPNIGIDDVAKTFNTPEKIASLLGSVEYDKERGKPMGGDGPLGTQKPEDTLTKFTGVCRDIHQVGAYLLKQNGYDAVQMGYVGARTSHSITMYKEPSGKGYGVIEYGKVYSPEKIKEMLGGRYASSPEEALNALNFGTATTIYKWTPPQKGQEGHVEGVFYTSKYQNYHKTLQLEHKDRIVIDRQLGLEIEKTLGEKFSIKAGVNFDSPGDPTAKNAVHATVGYKTGNQDNWFSASIGTQYRPNDGARIVGTTDWVSNPTLLAGADIRGQWTPLKLNFGQNHHTSTVLSGNMSGAFLALNGQKESDAGKIVTSDKMSFDMDYISGLPSLNLGVEQRFYGNISPKLSYSVSPFIKYNGALAVAGMTMGATNPADFANVGVNGKVTYKDGRGEVSLGGQYMAKQVDNLNNTGLGVEGKYNFGKLNVFGSSSIIKSVEGSRLMFGQGIGYDITKDISLNAKAQQEVILSGGNAYTNPGSINASIGLSAKF
jgi:hypothetical protein